MFLMAFVIALVLVVEERCELSLVVLIVAARPARAFHVFGSSEFDTRFDFVLIYTRQCLPIPSLLIKNSSEKAREDGRKSGLPQLAPMPAQTQCPRCEEKATRVCGGLSKCHVLLD